MFAPLERAGAWAAHIYTASGVLWALLTLSAIFDQRTSDVYLWMFIAVIVDATDGYLARKFRWEVLPHIDGALRQRSGLSKLEFHTRRISLVLRVAHRSGSPWAGCTDMQCICLVHTDAKVVEQGYFRGFPSY